MPSITVTDRQGRTMVISDIVPFVAEREEIVQRLERLYARYEQRPEDALAPHEAAICELVNSYHEYSGWIEQFAAEEQRLANIRAGYDLLRQIRGEQS